jgi:hypothetical protein
MKIRIDTNMNIVIPHVYWLRKESKCTVFEIEWEVEMQCCHFILKIAEPQVSAALSVQNNV